MVYRIYVEKKGEYAVEAASVLADLRTALGMTQISGLRLLNRYDLEGITKEDFEKARFRVFAEPQVDLVYDNLPHTQGRIFAVEYLPGQYDQRADSCAQCIQLFTHGERPVVTTARVFLLEGEISDADFDRIKAHLINPVESREASLELPATLRPDYPQPPPVAVLKGFTQMEDGDLQAFVEEYGLAMDAADLAFCRDYFRQERRDPTLTELRMIDTYWSDHCRHTTFLTRLEDIRVEDPQIQQSYQRYLELRATLPGQQQKPMTLMELATIGAKALRAKGLLQELDQSEEINACSVKIKVDVAGEEQEWLLMFKNETHNHPTEIEPFGGAATCLGGAIRDPLSGRSYVYQAMRVTGAGDPLAPISQTLPGKLPQRKLVTTAAAGYSSYGNQIGLATGHVHEIYHPGYVAKRMEIGAVLGAAPAANVRRERPAPGDVVVLLGGKTGRDGCGGATGSSKSHTKESLYSCGAEVQKGNPPEERKLQRLFRNPEVTALIKRCNDFGAGGVSVAVGELADGLEIDLSAVPKKYEGLDGTELAISESQERMAVVVAAKDVALLTAYADAENLDATPIAVVTEAPRLVMKWQGEVIVNLSRDFLNSNGAEKRAKVEVQKPSPRPKTYPAGNAAQRWQTHLADLRHCSQKGLVQRFDSTIGAGSVLLPFGGVHQLTPAQAMAAKLPVPGMDTTTCSLMAWGFDPELSSASPYHGAICAVVESVAKIVAAGGSRRRCWLTFQEYFERLGADPARWGKPFAALLGALEAQLQLEIGAIGGKDSMSGSFDNLDVPPTLVSFAVSTASVNGVISPEFKAAGEGLYLLAPRRDQTGTPILASVAETLDKAEALIAAGQVTAAWAVTSGGIAEGIAKMAFGNRLGFVFEQQPDDDLLYGPCAGAILLTSPHQLDAPCLGRVTSSYTITLGNETIDLAQLQQSWEQTLQPVFPYLAPSADLKPPKYSFSATRRVAPAVKVARPRVLIPVFPGTNCEYDTAAAFERAGASAEIFVVRNRTAAQIEQSAAAFAQRIAQSQIVAIPGGFSGGDEPEGSGKFITAFFRNPAITEAVTCLLEQRDGLMCGICNGFQALIKLGLVPYGRIIEPDESTPTLTFNAIGRHQSSLYRTRIASNKSPWLMHTTPGEVFTIAISHGEGRFVADEALIMKLAENGQIATQYVDLEGNPTMDIRYNPNGSIHAVEAITSPDGRVLGKMGHTERYTAGVFKNVPGRFEQPLFQGAVDYYN